MNGQGGNNILNVNDQGNLPLAAGARTYTVNATTVTRTDPRFPGVTNTITYSGLRNLTVNGSSNYTVTNTKRYNQHRS